MTEQERIKALEERNRKILDEEEHRWKKGTRRLTVGVAFATVLLLLYNVLLFLPIQEQFELPKGKLLLVVLYLLIAIALVFVCVQTYLRGLKRFALMAGTKHSMAIVRWGFVATVAGAILQVLLMGLFNIKEFSNLLISNSLLIVGCVIGIVGFASLATAKGMPDSARKGAINMTWTSIILLVGAVLLSYCVSLQPDDKMALNIVCVLINVVGAYFFYTNWRKMLNPFRTESIDDDEEDEPVDTTPVPQKTDEIRATDSTSVSSKRQE